jgi:pimeloyl-ACP methyl ester carboxylesterase
MIDHIFATPHLRLHYAEWENPGAPTLVLLHGGRDHCRSWDWVAHELSKDWRIIAPDLRGHGDSEWSREGNYNLLAFVHDFVQLAQHLDAYPLTIVGHSLGGNIAVRFTGLYPDRVHKLVSIEGLGLPPKMMAERLATGVHQRTRNWISEMEAVASRPQRRSYLSLEHALQRMREASPNLNNAQVRHLTEHGVRQNADGSFSWKFDPYVRPISPIDLSPQEVAQLWAAITCPVLLCYGEDSWASNPEQDGRARHFQNGAVRIFPRAGHWLHHDRFEMFISEMKAFL